MPSSTSSFDPDAVRHPASAPYLRGATWLLVGCAAVLLAAELFARWGLPRMSRIERRISHELAQARGLRDDRAVLLVGNSLLGTGVDMAALNARLQPHETAYRLYVESTGYYDWYYGARSLFAGGTRVKALVVVLNVRQLLAPSIRGDYTIGRLVDFGDIALLAGDLKLDPTQTSNLYFASLSRFYASRSEIRSALLGRIVPRFADLRSNLVAPASQPLEPDKARIDLLERLRELRAVTDEAGCQLVVVIPPNLQADPHEDLGRLAGEQSQTCVLIPLPSEQTRPEDYEPDQFHLETGARRFTQALADELLRRLEP